MSPECLQQEGGGVGTALGAGGGLAPGPCGACQDPHTAGTRQEEVAGGSHRKACQALDKGRVCTEGASEGPACGVMRKRPSPALRGACQPKRWAVRGKEGNRLPRTLSHPSQGGEAAGGYPRQAWGAVTDSP